MNRLRSRPLPTTLRDALPSALDALPDAELLDRFARYADHPAFAVLVRRYGPMVFGVCRRTLGRSPDADDAFQATFLVLVRKTRAVGHADRLGPWLYGVACRVAMKARARAARRAAPQFDAFDALPDPNPPADPPDWLPILDAELNALPAKYRDALVLCELQGAARADAARRLGVPEGTLSSRLARGRDLLRKRLLKHGTLLPAGGLAALFAAGEVGRAVAPAALLARTCELANAAAPAGAARLADAVIKSMFLTKLRTAGAALALVVALVAGLSAATGTGGKPAPPDEKGAARKDTKAPPPAEKPAPAGPKLPDRDALQGLWVLEKCDISKSAGKVAGLKEQRDAMSGVGKMRFLVSGDTWWAMLSSAGGPIEPLRVKLDPTKNPKWLDLKFPGEQANQLLIYELEGDRLRVCLVVGATPVRPAEFNLDADVPLVVMEFRREPLPPPAGDKSIVGTWVGGEVQFDNTPKAQPTQTVVALDGHLFFSGSGLRAVSPTQWTGGRYTVDTTKNPRWIDVELPAPLDDGKTQKLYGCYELKDGRLQIALGASRALRPLDFTSGEDILRFDLKAPKDFAYGPVAPAPRPKEQPADWRPELERLIKSGDPLAVEKHLRLTVPKLSGKERVEAQKDLAFALLDRAGDETPRRAAKVYDESAAQFRAAIADAAKLPATDKDAKRLRWDVELGLLVTLKYAERADELLAASTELLDRYRGTVEELVVLLMVQHAHEMKKETDKAEAVRKRVRELYAKLPDSVFPDTAGHFSRDFWRSQGYAK